MFPFMAPRIDKGIDRIRDFLVPATPGIRIEQKLAGEIAPMPELPPDESQAMALPLPAGTHCFVDANIFY